MALRSSDAPKALAVYVRLVPGPLVSSVSGVEGKRSRTTDCCGNKLLGNFGGVEYRGGAGVESRMADAQLAKEGDNAEEV